MFFTPQLHTLHVPEKREFHHWHPHSEHFASLSQWVSAVYMGWQVNPHVTRTIYTLSGSRTIRVYTFALQRGTQQMMMPVIASPPLGSLLRDQSFIVTDNPSVAAEETQYVIPALA